MPGLPVLTLTLTPKSKSTHSEGELLAVGSPDPETSGLLPGIHFEAQPSDTDIEREDDAVSPKTVSLLYI